MTERQFDVFVSHAAVNGRLATAFAAEFSRQGMRPFMAPFTMTYGREWKHDIIQALKECPVFAFIATPDSVASIACMHEIGAALMNYHTEKGRLVVPILYGVDFHSLPRWLADHHGMQYKTRDDAQRIEQNMVNIADWLKEEEKRRRWEAFLAALAIGAGAYLAYQAGKHSR